MYPPFLDSIKRGTTPSAAAEEDDAFWRKIRILHTSPSRGWRLFFGRRVLDGTSEQRFWRALFGRRHSFHLYPRSSFLDPTKSDTGNLIPGFHLQLQRRELHFGDDYAQHTFAVPGSGKLDPQLPPQSIHGRRKIHLWRTICRTHVPWSGYLFLLFRQRNTFDLYQWPSFLDPIKKGRTGKLGP